MQLGVLWGDGEVQGIIKEHGNECQLTQGEWPYALVTIATISVASLYIIHCSGTTSVCGLVVKVASASEVLLNNWHQ